MINGHRSDVTMLWLHLRERDIPGLDVFLRAGDDDGHMLIIQVAA